LSKKTAASAARKRWKRAASRSSTDLELGARGSGFGALKRS
jgi:hypothetical protein